MHRTNLGIEIGGTKLQVVTGDPAGTIHQRWRRQVNRAQGGAGIRREIESILHEVQAQGTIENIGIGFGGPVDWNMGRICCSHQIEGWSEFPLEEWLHSLSGAAVRVDNDANVAALGEAQRGSGRGRNPVFYVTLGSGVGGGLVVNGAVYHGARPGESEIGHLRLDRNGTIVEERCAGWAVDRRIRSAVQEHPGGTLARLVTGSSGGEARFLGAALAEGDELARIILREVAGDLALALSHVTHLFHPECIVLGGGLSLLGEPLRSAVADALQPFVMEAFRPVPEVALAGLGEDAVPIGALLLAKASLPRLEPD